MRIEDYGLIGDLQTAALVGRNGSIDWLCFPRFDSGACFAALLGDESNGRWLLTPDCEIERVERRYRKHSLVHELDFHTEHGSVRVTDFMPPARHAIPTSSASSRVSRGACRCGWSSCSASTTAGSSPGCAGSTTTPGSRSPARTRSPSERRSRSEART